MCMYILAHVRLCVFSQKLARWADLSGDRVVSGDEGAGKKVVTRERERRLCQGGQIHMYGVQVSTYIMSMQTLF